MSDRAEKKSPAWIYKKEKICNLFAIAILADLTRFMAGAG
jgi:hypothetical protein